MGKSFGFILWLWLYVCHCLVKWLITIVDSEWSFTFFPLIPFLKLFGPGRRKEKGLIPTAYIASLKFKILLVSTTLLGSWDQIPELEIFHWCFFVCVIELGSFTLWPFSNSKSLLKKFEVSYNDNTSYHYWVFNLYWELCKRLLLLLLHSTFIFILLDVDRYPRVTNKDEWVL